nr:RNA-directed DNA polymerase, eukaryota, reverse transcriptase zinc-binding domain protein [Tanacetum cinerariifolium]
MNSTRTDRRTENDKMIGHNENQGILAVVGNTESVGQVVQHTGLSVITIMVLGIWLRSAELNEAISKMKKRLSRWKLNTLSVGGRLTLLKSVLGSTPIYNMSIFKVKWSKVLASKKYGGLRVLSFYALNRALLFKWVWRYLSHDNFLWSRVISAIHGLNGQVLSAAFNPTWSSIINEVNSFKDKGVDLISHCKIRVGKGTCTSFWNDLWIDDSLLKLFFSRLYALEEKKHISVVDKMRTSISFFFRRPVRGGVESQQHDHLSVLLDSVILSNMEDRWFWDLNDDGVFRVKDVRNLLMRLFFLKWKFLVDGLRVFRLR